MTVAVAPGSRYLIVCDEVLPDPQRPGKLMIVGLTSLVVWPVGSAAPARLEKLTVLLILTDGRGVGTGRIVCRNEETGAPVFGSSPIPISFEGMDPAGHYAVTVKLLDCRFPAPGVNLVQFFFDDILVREQPITVR